MSFLRQHTQVLLLGDPSGAQVALGPAYQGRVMTSTTGGTDAPSFGWIGRAAIASVERWPEPVKAEWRRRGVYEVKNMRTGEILPMYPETLDDIDANARGTLDIPAAAGRLRCPWLIVHGRGDEAVPVSEADRLAAAAPHAERLTLDGAAHTFGAVHPWVGSTPDLDRVFDATAGFFGRHLA